MHARHRFLWAVGLALLAGCGAGLRWDLASEAPPSTAAQRSQRDALGSAWSTEGDAADVDRRLQALLAFSTRTHNRAEVLDALWAREALAQRRRAAATGSEEADAERALLRVRREVMRAALRAGEDTFALEVYRRALDPGPLRALAARIGDGRGRLTLPLPDGHREGMSARLLASQRSYTEGLSIDALRALGAPGRQVWFMEVERAQRDGDVERAAALAELMVEHDPMHVGARLVVQLASTPATHAAALAMPVGTTATSRQVAQLTLVHVERPDDPTVELALGWALLLKRLAPDARAVMARRDRAGSHFEGEQQAWAALDALADAEMNRGESVRRFVDDHGDARRSIYFADLLLARTPGVQTTGALVAAPEWDPVLRQATARVLEGVVERHGRDTPLNLATRAMSEWALEPATRRRAADAVAFIYPAGAAVYQRCLTEPLDFETCEARVVAAGTLTLGELPSGEGAPAPFEALGDTPPLDDNELYGVRHVPDEQLDDARQWIERLGRTRLGLSKAWMQVRMQLALRAGDTDAAEAMLSDPALARIPVTERLAMRLGWMDLVNGAEGLESTHYIDGLSWSASPFRPEPPPGVLALVRNLWSALGEDAPADLALDRDPAVQRLLPELPGAERAVLLGILGRLADRRGDDEALAGYLARAREAAPHSADTLGLSALEHERAGRTERAFRDYGRAWQARASARWAAARMRELREQLEADRPAVEAVGWLAATDAFAPASLEALVATGEVRTTAELVDEAARLRDRPESLDSTWLAHLPTDQQQRVLRAVLDQMHAADGASAAGERAAHLIRVLEAVDDTVEVPEEALWAYFLVGRDSAPQERVRDLAADAAVLDALPARAALTDELAHRVYLQLRDNTLDGELADALVARLSPGLTTNPLLCTALTYAERAEPAVAPCLRAFRAEHPGAIYRLRWALAAGSERVRRSAGLDQRSLLRSVPERWAEARGFLAGHLASAEAALGHHEDAWRPRLVELAHNHESDLTPQDMEGAQHRPASTRAQTTEHGWDRAATLVEVSLAAGELEMAHAYLELGRARGHRYAPEGRERFLFEQDLVAWTEMDLEAGVLTLDGLRQVEAMRNHDMDAERLRALTQSFPRSLLVRFMTALFASTHGRPQLAIQMLTAMIEEAPRPTLLTYNRPLWILSVGEERTETYRAELAARFPDDERLAPEEEAPPAELPWFARTAEAFTRRILAQDDRLALEEGELQRLSSAAAAAEIAMPLDAVLLSPRVGYTWGHVQSSVTAEPRHSDCTPETCVDQIVPQLSRLGLEQRHVTPAHLPVGEGRRILLTLGEQAFVATIVPIGLRVYALSSSGLLSGLDSVLEQHRLTELTFRPTDVVVGPARAERLRGDLPDRLPWSLLYRARVAVETADGDACPLGNMLADRTAEERAAALRALYLTSVEADTRRRIAACAQLSEPGHAALGIAASLDPDVRLHDFGHRAVASDTLAAGRWVEELAALPPEVPQAGTARNDTSLPRFGFVEMLAALPTGERRSVTERLSHSDDERVRALALASDFVAGGTLPRARLRQLMISGSPSDTLAVLDSFYGPLDTDDTRAIRQRLDAMTQFETPIERRLAARLSFLLTRRLDRRDLPRLERIMEATEGSDDDRERLWGRVAWDRELLRHALGIERSDDERIRDRAQALRLGRAQRTGPRRVSPEVAARLADTPLPEILPGAHWQYVRVPQPGLFLASLEQLYSRLQSSDAANTGMVRQTLEMLVGQNGGALLGPEGGLDLTRPVECARSDRFPPAWVCAAYVRDRDAVRTVLARRRYGTNSGAALAMDVSRLAAMLPAFAGALPLSIAAMVDPPERSDPPPGPVPGPVLDRQRVRSRVDLGGVEVERFGVFAVRGDDQPMSDTEHYLFTGDRILMFGLESTARAVLRTPRSRRQTLAGSPVFQRLTDDWADGAALQMASVDVGLGDGVATPSDRVSMELVANTQGLTVRFQTPLEQPMSDVSDLIARLPEGAVSQVGLAVPEDMDEDLSHLWDSDDPHQPPVGLLPHAEGFAFGWYAAPGQGLWDHWVSVLRGGQPLTEQLAASGVTLTDGASPVGHEGLFYARRGDLLAIGTHADEVGGTLDDPSQAASGQVGAGRLDGVRGARFLMSLATRLPAEDPRRAVAMGFAMMIGIGRELSFDAERSADGRTLRVVTRALPNLADEAGAQRIIDQALTSPRNALPLPRGVRDAERDGLRLVFETSDPEAARARLFAGRRRVAVEAIADDRVQVTVRASSEPEPLSDADRTRMTHRDAELSMDDQSIQEAARALGPAGTPVPTLAARASAWVHRQVRYELTSNSLSAATILRRGRGDCTEYARLTVALLRSRGIPAAVRDGFAVAAGELVAHAWVTYYDGERFRELDPTGGTASVRADHIPMSVADTIAFLSIGDLRVVEIGPAPAL